MHLLYQASLLVFIFMLYLCHQKNSYSYFVNIFIYLEYEYPSKPFILSKRRWVSHSIEAWGTYSSQIIFSKPCRRTLGDDKDSHPCCPFPKKLLLVLIVLKSTLKILKLSSTWSCRVISLAFVPSVWLSNLNLACRNQQDLKVENVNSCFSKTKNSTTLSTLS